MLIGCSLSIALLATLGAVYQEHSPSLRTLIIAAIPWMIFSSYLWKVRLLQDRKKFWGESGIQQCFMSPLAGITIAIYDIFGAIIDSLPKFRAWIRYLVSIPKLRRSRPDNSDLCRLKKMIRGEAKKLKQAIARIDEEIRLLELKNQRVFAVDYDQRRIALGDRRNQLTSLQSKFCQYLSEIEELAKYRQSAYATSVGLPLVEKLYAQGEVASAENVCQQIFEELLSARRALEVVSR